MYKLNILSPIKLMTVKELKDFIYKNYYRRIGFTKENNFYPIICNQINKKIPDPSIPKNTINLI